MQLERSGKSVDCASVTWIILPKI